MLYAVIIASALATPRVEVVGERIRLGDIARVGGSLATVDIGPAPQPGHSRVMTREQIRQRLRQAMVETNKLRLPKRVKVVRRRQVISEPELSAMLTRALAKKLPAGADLHDVHVVGGLVLAPGTIDIDVTVPRRVRSGRNSLRAVIQAGNSRPRTISFTAELEADASGPVIERGQRVQVVAISGAVVVRMTGVAQQSGRAGDTISVLPTSGHKMVRALVRDARTVEVQL